MKNDRLFWMIHVGFQSSKNMFKMSVNAYSQSQLAFEAERLKKAFYNANFQIKMLSTVLWHMLRCLINLILAAFTIPNAVYNMASEKDARKAIQSGGASFVHHLFSAVIDFTNVFVTFVSVAARSTHSVREGYEVGRSLSDGEPPQKKVEATKASDDYLAASALRFSPSASI